MATSGCTLGQATVPMTTKKGNTLTVEKRGETTGCTSSDTDPMPSQEFVIRYKDDKRLFDSAQVIDADIVVTKRDIYDPSGWVESSKQVNPTVLSRVGKTDVFEERYTVRGWLSDRIADMQLTFKNAKGQVVDQDGTPAQSSPK